MSLSADIRLTAERLDVLSAVAEVNAPGVGGIDLFLGITRAEESLQSGPLLHLDYHAYEEMAIAELRRIATRSAEQWSIAKAVIWHRLGVVAVGEASVIVAVGSPHRGEAFAACRYIIDELKKLAPIWKREVFAKTDRWQSPPAP